MKIIDGIPVCGDPVDAGALAQIKNCRERAEAAALMADHHKGYSCPIGGVVASQTNIFPQVVGFDIACGNKAVLTDVSYPEIREKIGKIMDDLWAQISFGIGRSSGWNLDHALFESDQWLALPVLTQQRGLKDSARSQLGTVGGGNHYVNLFHDEKDRVWVGVHFGSRGLGHKIATWFMDALGAADGMDSPPVSMYHRSDLGEQYLQAMELAGEYAYAGRDAVCNKVLEILGAHEVEAVHNHHNFYWEEEIDGLEYWVGRKGATPAYPGQKGFVGATMAERSVILEGVESARSRDLLYSTVHGAGRVMSRSQATGKVNRRTGELRLNPDGTPMRPPGVTREMMDQWVDRAGVELRGGGVDESPHCYKRLPEVLAEQGDTIRVLEWLTPVGVAMAGPGTVDPYKD